MPLPWELLLLKMFVFIQIGIAAFALVFPELMWERFDVTPISGLILSFEVAVLPVRRVTSRLVVVVVHLDVRAYNPMCILRH